MPSSRASSSSEVPSYPRGPKAPMAAPAIRSAVGSGIRPPASVYHLVDRGAMIREGLDGKRIAITGGTGFLGTALIERLLRCVPGCELVLLIRPGRLASVEKRLKREIFANNAFDRRREDRGKDGFAEMVAERVTPIAGDVGTDGLGLDEAGRGLL